MKPTITHVLSGIESVPRTFEITANKGAHKAINPAQVLIGPVAADPSNGPPADLQSPTR